jgi:hypothetical protein
MCYYDKYMKDVYALQPYQVGSRNGKSLAIVIPAQVAKKYDIDTSTIFALKGNDSTRMVTLQTVPKLSRIKNNTGIPTGHLEGRNQQVGAQ